MPDLSYEEFVAAQRWPVASIDRRVAGQVLGLSKRFINVL
jgi:hypothetical protein